MFGDGKYLSAGEAAELLGYGKSTVHRMFDEGELAGYVTDRGGHRRIAATSIAERLRVRPPSLERDAALARLNLPPADAAEPVSGE